MLGPGLERKGEGFTLIELMIAVAIIGILTAIALPKFANMTRRAKEAVVLGQLGAIRSAISIYYSDNDGTYPHYLSSLVSGGKYMNALPNMDIPSVPEQNNPGHGGSAHPASGTQNISASAWNDPSLIPGNDEPTWQWTGEIWWEYEIDGGLIRIPCMHNDSKGQAWSAY